MTSNKLLKGLFSSNNYNGLLKGISASVIISSSSNQQASIHSFSSGGGAGVNLASTSINGHGQVLLTGQGHHGSAATFPSFNRTHFTSQLQVDMAGNPNQNDRKDFESLFSELVKVLVEDPDMKDMEETNRWLAKVLQYNVPHGKKNRGLSTALAYRYMAQELNEDNMKLSYVAGWCVELLQAFFLVSDDIMDGSETRRGRPCWYKVDDLGPAGFNDSLLLESAIYPLLKKYFRTKDYYVDLLEIFHDATFKTCYGQSLDTRTGLERNMEGYTLSKYSAIVKYKTSYYSFYLPVALAMAMTGIKNKALIEQVKKITLEMGHFFQVQDDYLDCFGDVSVTGKVGTDIQDCKCSWLFVVALKRASDGERRILMENYGRQDQDSVERVKQLYLAMGIPQLYAEYEEQTFKNLSSEMQELSSELPKQLFLDMLMQIYGRKS